MLIDSHAHLTLAQFDQDRSEVIDRAKKSGIEYIINVGTDLNDCTESVKIAESYDFIYAAIGIHPHEVKTIDSNTYGKLKELSDSQKVIALGEIGLDFFRNLSPPDLQKEKFRELIKLGKELRLPFIIHCRNAHQDTLAILEDEKAGDAGGVIHCFSGNIYQAQEYLSMGFYISIPGTVTFSKAYRLQEVVRSVPIERLLLETDSPFLAPHPYRGKRNEPSYVKYTAKKVGEIKDVEYEQVLETTSQNALLLFGIERKNQANGYPQRNTKKHK